MRHNIEVNTVYNDWKGVSQIYFSTYTHSFIPLGEDILVTLS